MTYLDDYKQSRELVKQGCPDFDYCYLFNKESLNDTDTPYDKILIKCSKESGYSKGHVRNILNGYSHADLRTCIAIIRGLGYDSVRDNIFKFFRLDCEMLEANIADENNKYKALFNNLEVELKNTKNKLKKVNYRCIKLKGEIKKISEENKKLKKLVDYYEKVSDE